MNVTVRQLSFRGCDGSPAMGWLYLPGERVRAVIQICHGMTEHMGRYHEFMRFLARGGYAVCGADHPGHGRSAGPEGYGFFAEQDGGRLLLDNQYKFSKIIQKELPGCPMILLGHSMGSFVARLFASKYPAALAGLILSGTGRGNPMLDAAIALAGRSVKKYGPRHVDKTLDAMAFGMFNRPFSAEHPKNGWLSRDLEQVRRYSEDPMCNFTFTVSALRDLFLLLRACNEKSCFAGTRTGLPLLIFSGAADPVGERGKGVRQVYERYLSAGLTDAQLILYEGGRHEMLNETNRQQVYDDVLLWLDSHFPPPPEPVPNPYEEWEG